VIVWQSKARLGPDTGQGSRFLRQVFEASWTFLELRREVQFPDGVWGDTMEYWRIDLERWGWGSTHAYWNGFHCVHRWGFLTFSWSGWKGECRKCLPVDLPRK